MDVIPRLPEGCVVRAPQDADRPAIHALIAAVETAEYGTPDEAMIAGVEMTWDQPSFVLDTDAWAVATVDGRLAAYGHISPADRVHLYAHAFVHPDCTGRGIGSWLLASIESRARARQAEASAPDGATTLEQWIAATNISARELLAGAGYAEVRHMWGMAVALDDTPKQPELPTGITIRSCAGEAESDLRQAHAAIEEAFRDGWQYEPRTFEQFMARETPSDLYDPSLWFLALEGDEVAGAELCEVYMASGRGWVNTLGVRPAWRGRGVASALLRHAFGEFWRRGLREAALGVDAQNPTGATRVYERVGMRIERQYDIFEKGL